MTEVKYMIIIYLPVRLTHNTFAFVIASMYIMEIYIYIYIFYKHMIIVNLMLFSNT